MIYAAVLWASSAVLWAQNPIPLQAASPGQAVPGPSSEAPKPDPEGNGATSPARNEPARSLWDQEEEEVEGASPFLEVRTGAWFHRAFQAETAQGSRRIRNQALFDAGFDLGYRLEPFTFRASLDYAGAKALDGWIFGAGVGILEPLPVLEDALDLPLLVEISVGAARGSMTVDLTGFGNFDPAWGFEARAQFLAPLQPGVLVSLWAEFRSFALSYEGMILAGDRKAFGPSVVLGVALVFSF